MDDILGAIFGICCNGQCWSAMCSTECRVKCFECPGETITKSCNCVKDSLKNISCACCSNFCSSCFSYKSASFEKCFENSCCLSMEENCLKLCNCSNVIQGFSECIHTCLLYEELKCLCCLRCLCDGCLINIGYNPYEPFPKQHARTRQRLARRSRALRSGIMVDVNVQSRMVDNKVLSVSETGNEKVKGSERKVGFEQEVLCLEHW